MTWSRSWLALGDRPIDYGAIPVELGRTGLASVGYARWALALYASLSPDQVGKARSPEGLPYAEMNLVQQQQVAEAVAKLNRSLPREEVPRSVLCITESSREAHGRRFDTTGFQIKLPSGTCETAVTLLVPPPPAAQAPGAGSGGGPTRESREQLPGGLQSGEHERILPRAGLEARVRGAIPSLARRLPVRDQVVQPVV